MQIILTQQEYDALVNGPKDDVVRHKAQDEFAKILCRTFEQYTTPTYQTLSIDKIKDVVWQVNRLLKR